MDAPVNVRKRNRPLAHGVLRDLPRQVVLPVAGDVGLPHDCLQKRGQVECAVRRMQSKWRMQSNFCIYENVGPLISKLEAYMKLWGQYKPWSAAAFVVAFGACTGSGPMGSTSDGVGDDLGPLSSSGVEFEGVVVSVDPTNGTFTLDDGTVVHVSDGSVVDGEGDLDTLEELAEAVGAGATVRVEGRASDDGTFEATEVEFEVDDEAEDGEVDDEDDEAENDEDDGEVDDEDDEAEDDEDDEDDGEVDDEDDEAEDDEDDGEVDDEDDGDDEDDDDEADDGDEEDDDDEGE